MFSFKLFSKLSALMLCLLLPLLASSVAVAAPFTVTYTDTIAGGSDTPPFNTGEAFTISIVVDNGGTSAVSQIWTPADVVSITFSMNDAPNTITTVFSPVVFSFSNGTFITDAAGVLTAVPDNLTDINGGNDELGFSTIASTNDTATPTSFFINGGNGVYHNSDEIGVSNNTARMTNVANNIIAANWTNPAAAMAPATAVPTLSQWAMILLIMLLMTVGLLKTRRHS